ncbi:lipoprotein [Bacillus spizizenii]|uniref:Lipoprotein, putative n=1 Tax=Bacillus spizizenii (strain DSM 15029 / JCM 12233 / NBRC 101239 / NRRL B-23049 / TU-B-10) TaxID=1052585 RepID=G4NQQ0_BACS4|nr:lipoprotein, putative [Bacillus spizizenii TU-B-10]GEK26720.1 putative lipoprotein YdeJ [Bacillus spizizenii]
MKKLRKIFYCNVILLLLILMLVGCTGSKKEETNNPSDNESTLQSEENNDETEDSNQIGKNESESTGAKESVTKDSDENSSKESVTKGSEKNSSKEPVTKGADENSTKESVTKDSDKNSSKESSTEESNETSEGRHETKGESDNILAEYSSEKVEYARVWLQLGANQKIDELNVRHISAGEPINPNDDKSASYPEDVIQLAGSRLVDGSVTYSGNGDGTINVYNVPLRWDSSDNLDQGVMKKVTENIIKNTKKVYVDTGDDKKIKRLIDIMVIH